MDYIYIDLDKVKPKVNVPYRKRQESKSQTHKSIHFYSRNIRRISTQKNFFLNKSIRRKINLLLQANVSNNNNYPLLNDGGKSTKNNNNSKTIKREGKKKRRTEGKIYSLKDHYKIKDRKLKKHRDNFQKRNINGTSNVFFFF